MGSQGYYAILGVSHDANYQEIKKSYRKLAKKITLTETNHRMQKRQSKKLTKHSKFFLIGGKESNTI
jgi:DnaJ-class molecular chaperone